ncbi:hypothetical protein MA16_Dca023363 [Dendrobium catenatum]|uniref:Uncharacterized protein n=1 Tax=Dendrobium catenatum TaxID=906689 RepID=A0A2I0WJL1_9ASPA|nr:hypothetical protein MA16_Dca023363 [Dendrobium catenatum]
MIGACCWKGNHLSPLSCISLAESHKSVELLNLAKREKWRIFSFKPGAPRPFVVLLFAWNIAEVLRDSREEKLQSDGGEQHSATNTRLSAFLLQEFRIPGFLLLSYSDGKPRVETPSSASWHSHSSLSPPLRLLEIGQTQRPNPSSCSGDLAEVEAPPPDAVLLKLPFPYPFARRRHPYRGESSSIWEIELDGFRYPKRKGNAPPPFRGIISSFGYLIHDGSKESKEEISKESKEDRSKESKGESSKESKEESSKESKNKNSKES